MNTYIPYCGTPPTPEELWQRWNFDPMLIGVLLLFLVTYFALRVTDRRRRLSFLAGWSLTAALFVSPICALSMALFAARIGQHITFTLLAAPLLAWSLPFWPRLHPLAVAPVFAALFWFWHAPGPYDATLQSDTIYWVMHSSLLGTAVLLWAALLHNLERRPGSALLGALLTGTQMSLLSALLVFSQSAWHVWHLAAAPHWGLDALADQQLAGAIMWVSGGILFAGAVATMVSKFLREETRRPIST